jgi:hypothetical protein
MITTFLATVKMGASLWETMQFIYNNSFGSPVVLAIILINFTTANNTALASPPLSLSGQLLEDDSKRKTFCGKL